MSCCGIQNGPSVRTNQQQRLLYHTFGTICVIFMHVITLGNCPLDASRGYYVRTRMENAEGVTVEACVCAWIVDSKITMLSRAIEFRTFVHGTEEGVSFLNKAIRSEMLRGEIGTQPSVYILEASIIHTRYIIFTEVTLVSRVRVISSDRGHVRWDFFDFSLLSSFFERFVQVMPAYSTIPHYFIIEGDFQIAFQDGNYEFWQHDLVAIIYIY